MITAAWWVFPFILLMGVIIGVCIQDGDAPW